MAEELTLKQVLERRVQDGEKSAEAEKDSKPKETAADRRNFFRKQAGWPLLRVK